MSRAPAIDRNVAGAAWELAARRHLEAAGLQLLGANQRYRSSDAFGGSVLSVDTHKQRKLILAARTFLAANPAFARKPCRFDVVAVDGSVEPPRVEWIRNAFDAF